MQMLFSRPELCKKQAFHIWMARWQVEDRLPPWSDEVKAESIQALFDLFDADGSGAVDPLELKITLHALGFEEEDSVHLRVARLIDTKGTGNIDVSELRAAFERLIRRVFAIFVVDPTSEAITACDLRRVAESLGEEADDEVLRGMVGLVDGGDRVGPGGFEQLMLQRPAESTGRTPLRRSRGRGRRRSGTAEPHMERAARREAEKLWFALDGPERAAGDDEGDAEGTGCRLDG